MRIVPFVLILFILLFGVVAAVDTLSAPSADVGPTPVRPTVTPRPRPTSPRPEETTTPVEPALPAFATAPQVTAGPAAPAPTATPSAQSVMKIGNTGGEGVYIRRTPNMSDKIRPWQDGTTVTVLGPAQTISGINWLKVRAPDGVEGYIPEQYLVP